MKKEVIFDTTDELTEDDLRALFEEEEEVYTASELKQMMQELEPGESLTIFPEEKD